MKVCLSMLRDGLSMPAEVHNGGEEPTVERYAFLQGEGLLEAGIAYLARAEDLGRRLEFEPGSCLVCIGEPPEGAVDAKLPLMSLPGGLGLTSVANELGGIFQEYNGLEASLNEAVLQNRGLQDLVDIMARFVDNEITIADSSHLVLARSTSEPRNLAMSGYKTDPGERMLPLEVIEFFANNKRWVEARTETEPFIYDEGVFDRRLLCVNIISDVTFSCRVMMAETDQEFRPYDPYLLTFLAGYVRIVYEQAFPSKAQRKATTLRESLLTMLSGSEVEPWLLRHGLSVMGITKDARFVCVCARPEYWDDSLGTISYYCEQIAKLFPGAIAVEFHGDIVCLACIDRYAGATEGFLGAFTPFVRDNNFRVGVSETFSSIALVKDFYRQAEIALTLGIGERPSQWVHRFYEQMVDFSLRQAGQEGGMRALCSEKVLRLREYDVANDASYVPTLQCYLMNGLSIAKSAAELAIHRATMVYRLKRVEEIAGIAFNDAEKNLFYLLSARMVAMMDD